MEDTLHRMQRVASKGWDMYSYENFGDWAAELEGIHKSSTLDKHRNVLIRLGRYVSELGQSLETDQEVTEPEARGTKAHGKGKRSAEIEETEQVSVYYPPVGSSGPLLDYLADPILIL